MAYDKIEVLGNLEAIRKVPSMYIGSTDTPMQLFHELFCNSLDESLNGYGRNIRIDADSEGWISIQDDGRGFPIYKDKKENEWSPIVACTKSHSGGKFNKDAYLTSGGLHGLGLTCCTALCDSLKLSTSRDGKTFFVIFEDGLVKSKVVDDKTDKSLHGTMVSIKPSLKYFKSVKWDFDLIETRAKLACLFIPKLHVHFNGKDVEAPKPNEIIQNFDGEVFDISCKTKNGETARAIFGYSLTKTDRNYNGAVNLISVNNGIHVRILERAISDSWQDLVDAPTKGYLSYNDYTVGLSGFILINVLNPSYTSQTKETLAGSLSDYKDLQEALKESIKVELKKRLSTKFIQTLLHRFKDYRKSQNEMSSSKYLDEVIKYGDADDGNINRSSGLSSKLVDCKSSDRETTELILCEGDSAGGSLIARRNIKTQAVLPLRGKTLNVIDQDLQRILANLEIRSLINSLGVGVLHKEMPERVRYGKIIIAADGDVDGCQIQALLLGALCYLTPGVVAAGRVYIADSPLWGQVDSKGVFTPIWNQSELKPKQQTFRFKGLGSLDPEEIEATLLNEKTRKIYQIILDDVNKVLHIVGQGSYKKQLLIDRGLLV